MLDLGRRAVVEQLWGPREVSVPALHLSGVPARVSD